MDKALEAPGDMDTTIEVEIKEERRDIKLVGYTMWSHGRLRQDEGRSMGAIPGPFGCGYARETRPHGWKRE